MKLKEVNRGLVLGLVLLIGVVFHVNWQNYQFKENIPVMKQTVEEYGKELLNASLGDKKGFKQRATSAIQNAYTGKGEIPEEVYATKGAILSEIDDLDIDLVEGTLYDADFKVLDFKAKKSGSGARVDVSYELDLTVSGMPAYVCLSGADIASPWNFTDPDKKIKMKREGSINLYMKKDGGSWKVAYVFYDMTYSESEEFASNTSANDAQEVSADE